MYVNFIYCFSYRHLVQVDTKDDDNVHGKYVPYWASRHDFKLVISHRMTADHSMLDLVEILNNIRLDEDDNKSFGRSSIIASTLINSMNIRKGDDSAENNSGTDARLFMCCSNPDGKIPICISFVVATALVLSLRAMTVCTFFSSDERVFTWENVTLIDIPFSMGLFSYTLLECEGGNCSGTNETIVPSKFCAPYPDGEEGEGMTVARAFALFVLLFGGFSFLLLCVSTCLSLQRRAWTLISCMLLLTSLCQGLVFLMKKSTLCVGHSDEGSGSLEASCEISTGGHEAIAAGCIYFSAAFLSSIFIRRKIM